MATSTILVFGAGGQLGRELQIVRPQSSWKVVGLPRPAADLTVEGSIARQLGAHKPSVVINAAAYTDVEAAESDVAGAMAVNAYGAGSLARACDIAGTPLIHVSTDYVFDGRSDRPYVEADGCNPINVYGHSKHAGEMEVVRETSRAVIVRTSWLFSPWCGNFVRTMLRCAAQKPILGVVDDQWEAPTAAADLADALLRMAPQLVREDAAGKFGIYHYSGATRMTWHGFAERIFAESVSHGAPVPELWPVNTGDYRTKAARPSYSVLDCSRISAVFGLEPVVLGANLSRAVKMLLASNPEYRRRPEALLP
jgi:dTDP-4-dehydrorhamnose reductase